MIRLISTALLSATLALSPIAPAQAQMSNDELTKILLGAAAVGAIGLAIDKAKDRKEEKARKARETLRNAKNKNVAAPVRDGRGGRSRALPARCVDIVEGPRGGIRQVLSKRCLKDTTNAVRHLPHRCERDVYAFGRYRTVYGTRCLERYGWTVARHR
ncbi:hypothetical protein ILP92_01340 [Maribius pontilimi]|uniref:Uncharacterized protein n=1 Tax=Palleronia pontilimi TaxID=1964209 RepID=A0A934IDA3_9RHOB|nr:hypothetical protein [Palleronia pontilimi]MBJ3761395.1 hypothetical protein [Palleronia pontilimi]